MRYLLIILFFVLFISCTNQDKTMTYSATDFLSFATEFESTAKQLDKQMGEAYFAAAKNGSEENWNAFAVAELALNVHFADSNAFAEINKFRQSKSINDKSVKRHIEVLYLDIQSKQINKDLLEKISKKQSEIEKKYTEFRAEVNGKKYDDNQVEYILKTSQNSDELQAIWEAHKNIGPTVENDVIELVKLRNEAAISLGYDNYHQMSLILSEQDPAEISNLLDELDALTQNTYIKIKNEIDDFLLTKLKITKEQLMPWHYQNRYFQEAPQIFEVNLDKYYENEDVVKITNDYFAGIGMPIEDMIAKSDLYPRENKNQHAFCINIERDSKDIRVLCNVVPNHSWMETMLHEYGHAVYEQYYADTLPWSLKEPAHIFTTEAIAMLFGRMASDPQWIQDNIKIDDAEKDKLKAITKKILAYQQLVFSRWVQVMYRFEKSMYENPNQDLNALWWQIVEKYQMIKKPEDRNMPDWATKIHIATVPAYYHNYLLGEILALQIYYKLIEKIQILDGEYPIFSNNHEIGKFLKSNIFAPGRLFTWNDMIERALGEKLTAKYYAKQFVD